MPKKQEEEILSVEENLEPQSESQEGFTEEQVPQQLAEAAEEQPRQFRREAPIPIPQPQRAALVEQPASCSREAAYYINNLPDDSYRITLFQQLADAGISPDAGILSLLMWAIEQRQLSILQQSPFTVQAQEILDMNPSPLGAGQPTIAPNVRVTEPQMRQCEAQASGCQGMFAPERNRAGQRFCRNPACWQAGAGLMPVNNPVHQPKEAISEAKISAIVANAVAQQMAKYAAQPNG